MDGPRCLCIAGPEIFASADESRRRITTFEIAALLRNLSGLISAISRLGDAWPSRPSLATRSDCRRRKPWLCLATFGHARTVTPRLARSRILTRWCHWLLFPCGPGGLSSAPAPRRLDHMIGGDALRSLGVTAQSARQVSIGITAAPRERSSLGMRQAIEAGEACRLTPNMIPISAADPGVSSHRANLPCGRDPTRGAAWFSCASPE